VRRAEMAVTNMDAYAAMIQELYVHHRPQFRHTGSAPVKATNQAAVAGSLTTGFLQWQGARYIGTEAGGDGMLIGAVCTAGTGTCTSGREEIGYGRGDVFLEPAFQPYDADLHDLGLELVQIPHAVAGALAEEATGLPSAHLRFESMAPVSAAAGARWARTVRLVRDQLLDSGITEISPLVLQELTRLTAAGMLEAFPSTMMTLPYLPGPGWVPPATVRRTVGFIDTYADRPVTLDQIAAVAGVSGRALQYAFRRHYGTTPMGYLRGVRLARARAQLQAAQPGDGTTLAAVARQWGWANPAHFAAAYRHRFGVAPSHTLRT
jgi:AraC-like DNA-binding protein